MATDLYVNGRRWRVSPGPASAGILQKLKDEFGAVDTIFGLQVIDEDGNEGVIRVDPSRLASIAIVAVPD